MFFNLCLDFIYLYRNFCTLAILDSAVLVNWYRRIVYAIIFSFLQTIKQSFQIVMNIRNILPEQDYTKCHSSSNIPINKVSSIPISCGHCFKPTTHCGEQLSAKHIKLASIPWAWQVINFKCSVQTLSRGATNRNNNSI